MFSAIRSAKGLGNRGRGVAATQRPCPSEGCSVAVREAPPWPLKLGAAADENLSTPRPVPLPSPPPTDMPTAALPSAAAWPRLARRMAATALGLVLALLPAVAPRAWDGERVVRAAERLSPQAGAEARALVATVNEARRLDEERKLALVNQFFNQHIAFREDTEVWGQIDYWASPLEALNRGAGDCEDYAIAKYFALIAAGVPSPKLRLVYVRAQLGGAGGPVQAHMVLAYYGQPDAQPLILDNLIGDIRPASRRPDLAPVFSFNAEGLWQGVGPSTAGDPLARLSRWRDALNKARLEGVW